VPRHADPGHDPDEPLPGILDDFADIVLVIEAAVAPLVLLF